MWTPKSNKRDRPYRVKKTGIKDENIDRQILVLHQAIAAKLLAEPALLEQVKAKLDERKAKMRQRMQEKMAEHHGKADSE